MENEVPVEAPASESKPKRKITKKTPSAEASPEGAQPKAQEPSEKAAPKRRTNRKSSAESQTENTGSPAETNHESSSHEPSRKKQQVEEISLTSQPEPQTQTQAQAQPSGENHNQNDASASENGKELRDNSTREQRPHQFHQQRHHQNPRRQGERYSQGGQQGQNNPRHQNHRHQNNRQPQFEKSRPLRTKYLDLLKEPEESIRNTAVDLNIPNLASKTFSEVTYDVFSAMVQQEGQGLGVCKGILEVLPDGYGFVRDQLGNMDQNDVYVSAPQIKKLGLRTGDHIVGQTRAPKDNESYQALLRVECINDCDPDEARKIVAFDSLVPLYPNQKFNLQSDAKDPSVRIVDLITPIGRGQRGLIVAPPKAGKTTLLKQIANALTSNHPDLTLFVLLIDERPEEVTDMTRSVEGEVIASTFDQHLNNHIRVSEIVLERAKRLVEQGKDVVILLDSITRLARAYNIAIPSSGQTLSGGVNPLALYKPKKFFGSARNIEFGGSLTILATALVDTGSKMDDVIFEEFKGTGNMELHLDRALFNKRVFPAINLTKSSTRRDELLVSAESLKGLNILRRVFENLSAQEAIELLKKQVKTTRTNEDFLSQLQKQAGLSNT